MRRYTPRFVVLLATVVVATVLGAVPVSAQAPDRVEEIELKIPAGEDRGSGVAPLSSEPAKLELSTPQGWFEAQPPTGEATDVEWDPSFSDVEPPELTDEVVELRGVAGEVWNTADGGVVLRALDDLKYYDTGEGLAEIDTTLLPVEGREGWYRSGANQFEVRFGPMSSGAPVEFTFPDGSPARLVPSVPPGRAGKVEMVVDAAAGRVTYVDVFPGIDLRYTATPTGIKEDIVLNRPGNVPRFETIVEGVELAEKPDSQGLLLPAAEVARGADAERVAGDPVPGGLAVGQLVIEGADGSILPVGAEDASVTAKPSKDANGQIRSAVSVGVSEKWLASLSDDVFPVVLDPGWYAAWAIGAGSPAPEAMWHASSPATQTWWWKIRAGNSRGTSGPNGDSIWRSRMRFDNSWYGATMAQIVAQEWGIESATLKLVYESGTTPARQICAGWSNDARTYAGMYPGQYASPLDCGPVSGSGESIIPITNVARTWLNEEETTPWLGIKGEETPGVYTYKGFSNAAVDLYLRKKPARPVAVAPVDEATFTTLTPTLTVQPSAPGEAGQTVWYWYRISTSPNVDSDAIVADSGWTGATSWTVPAGVLEDGVKYYWNAKAIDPAYGLYNNSPWVRSFSIDRRLGLGDATQPYETFGPGSVNLTNGNYVVNLGTPGVDTVGGGLSAGLVFNSQAPVRTGLVGTYTLDKNLNGVKDAFELPFQKRLENPHFDWGSGSPLPGTSGWSDNFFVDWAGMLTVPYSGVYKFGASYDDGVTMTVNGTLAYNKLNGPPANLDFGTTTVSLTAGQPVPIQLSFQEKHGAAKAFYHIWCISGDCVGKVPGSPSTWMSDLAQDWLSPSARFLPAGWELATSAAGGGGWLRVKQVGADVVATTTSGTSMRFTSGGSGSWKAPTGTYETLTRGADGRFVLVGNDGYISTFNTAGNLESVSSPIDAAHPAAAQLTYDPQSRPSTVADPVSGREIEFVYAGTPGSTCPTFPDPSQVFDPAPPGLLCQIRYPNSTASITTVTNIWYKNGLVSRIWNPGYEQYDFGWSAGKLVQVYDPHVNDAIAHGVAGVAVGDADWDITYTSDRVSTVTAPRPAAGQNRPAGKLLYNSSATPLPNTVLQTMGLTTANVYSTARTVYYEPDSYRVVKTTGADGTVVEQAWNPNDTLKWSKDSAGRVSTYHYDFADRLTDTYGPAPQSCFNTSTWLPNGTCTNPAVAHAHTGYDEGLGSLSVMLYDNRGVSGAPASYQRDSNTHLDAGVSWKPAGSNWSAAYQGKFYTAGGAPNDTFTAWFHGGLRLYVDDVRIIDAWDAERVWNPAAVAGQTMTAGWHDIRIEYQPHTNGTTGFHLRLGASPGVGSIPTGNDLAPMYGLATSSTIDDNGGSTPSLSTATTYDEPWTGLATQTRVDPTGVDLTADFGYESTYYRRTSREMPSNTAWTYQWYGATDAPVTNTCTGVAASQAGMAKKRYYQASTNRPDAYVYDVMGRQIGSQVDGGTWACSESPWV